METMVRPQEDRVEARPDYIKPSMKMMNETEILSAFQMTAAKISAAGCWWGACACVSS